MQMEATDAFDISRETEAIREMYGDSVHSRQLFIARRLVERGLRVVQCQHGEVQPWDSRDMIADAHRNLDRQVDSGIGVLLSDLQKLGLLEDTLVVCGGEFGRTPAVDKPVHVRDLHATMLHLMGLDQERLTYRFAGRDLCLTDIAGEIVHGLLA
jgi:hypothetical protein